MEIFRATGLQKRAAMTALLVPAGCLSDSVALRSRENGPATLLAKAKQMVAFPAPRLVSLSQAKQPEVGPMVQVAILAARAAGLQPQPVDRELRNSGPRLK
jgi:hypothetical protein